jgi:hypothetical protein
MPSRYDVIPATPETMAAVAEHLRAQDFDEIQASETDLDARDYLIASFHKSSHAWVATADGVPILAFGVFQRSWHDPVAFPWFYGTTHLRKHRAAFLRGCKPYLDGLRSTYPNLRNAVDAGNAKAIQWLEWLGFTVDEDIVYLPGCTTPLRRYWIGSPG